MNHIDTFIFDFDDCIVRYTKRGITVPKETWHALRRLSNRGCGVYIISYNVYAKDIAGHLGLFKYVKDVVSEDYSDHGSRSALVEKLTSIYPEICNFVYFDDNEDNIAEVKAGFGNSAICIRVTGSIKCSDLNY